MTGDSTSQRRSPDCYRSLRPEAIAAGVAIIHQELQYVPDLTVTENLLLGRLPNALGWVDPLGLSCKGHFALWEHRAANGLLKAEGEMQSGLAQSIGRRLSWAACEPLRKRSPRVSTSPCTAKKDTSSIPSLAFIFRERSG